MRLINSGRRVLAPVSIMFTALLGVGAGALQGTCGPFTDTPNDAFCQFIVEVFYMEITTGTTPTTYDPTGNVTRTQMAAFLSRSVDRVLLRGNRRSALDQFWTSQDATVLGLTTVGAQPMLVRSDGEDLWVTSSEGVSRVHASDGKLLGTWTGAVSARGVLVAMGRIFITADASPGELYEIDPSQPPGAVTTIFSNGAAYSNGIAFDGSRIWTANNGSGPASGSVSIITPAAVPPWTVTTLTTGFNLPDGALFDGANIWVTDIVAKTLLKLDSNGAVLQTVTVGNGPEFPVFDGTNIWVPNYSSNSVSVVRATSGAVLRTLTGNGLSNPIVSAFDGLRVLVTNYGGDSVSLWKAADLTSLGSFSTGTGSVPFGACSDGVNFWVTLINPDKLARF
ncbi:MAG TPA: hypothetical protein VKG01_04505 [Thermoanaerobaculia bacterium]|nr:hypothetical protein [Thermoanaerobaculia bacterium]